MGFGEYQGMTDREVMIAMLSKIKNLETKLDGLNFPCNERAVVLSDHDNRLQRIEDDIKQVAEKRTDKLLVYGLLISAIAGWGGLLIMLVDILSRG